MLRNYRYIKKLITDLRDDFAWVEIKWEDKYGCYISIINYIDDMYIIDRKKADYNEVKLVIKQALKDKKEVKLVRMERTAATQK